MPASLDRRPTIAAAIAAACLFVPLLIPVLIGRVFPLGDLADFHLPVRHLYQSALTEGHSILWTHQMFGGFYLHAEGQVGAFHPLHLVLYRLLSLPTAFGLELVASYVFCFAGMLLLLHRFGLSAAARVIGAVAFTFSGFNLLHLLHMNAVAVVAHVPWMLLALEGIGSGDTRRQSRSAGGLAMLVGSILLLGYPQYVWMAALICTVYLLVHLRRMAPRSLWIALSGAFVGLLVGAVQLLPTLDLLSESVRQTTTEDFALTYSLHPLNLAQLFSPYLLATRVYAAPAEFFIHEFGIYNGAFCTLAGAWVLLRWRHLPAKRMAVFGLALIIVGIVFSLGRYGLVYEAVAALPLVGKFRAPARHIALVHLGLALLAAVAFDDIQTSSAQRRSVATGWLWLPFVISIGVAVASWTWIWAGWGFEEQSVEPAGAFLGTTLVLVVTLWLIDAARGSRNALIGIPVILCLDLGLWGYGYVLPAGMRTVPEIAARLEAPPATVGATLHASQASRPNLLLLRDFAVARPYVGLYPERLLPLETTNELRVAGVEWLQTTDGWRSVADPMPRLRIVPEWLFASDPVSAMSGVDVRRVGVVDRELPSLRPGATVVSITDVPGEIVADVVAPGHALLATTEAYHAGWRVRADDEGSPQTLRVYGDYLGVLLPPGRYRLTLAFKPASAAFGAYLSITGLALALGLAILVRRSGGPTTAPE